MDNLLTVPQLKERGWTKTLIEKFLPKHDELRDNPRYRNAGAPMKLYKKKKVERVEKTKKFMEAMALSNKRKESAENAVATKKKEIKVFLSELKITIPKLDRDTLLERARDNFNQMGLPVGVQISPERMCVNYLRHCESAYERLLDEMTGKIGGPAAYLPIKEKVLTQISLTYEWLQGECTRQLEEMKRNSTEGF